MLQNSSLMSDGNFPSSAASSITPIGNMSHETATTTTAAGRNQSNGRHFHVEELVDTTYNVNNWHERLELRGCDVTIPMSHNNAFTPPSRPPSSASSASSLNTTNNLPRIHSSSTFNGISYVGGHDHTRPLPPPRLNDTTTFGGGTPITTISSSSSSSLSGLTIAPLTVPLAPLSTNASFRSNNSRTSGIGSTSTTTTSNNNNNNNNNINNNNNNNNNATATHQPNIGDSSVVVTPTNSPSAALTSRTSDSARSPLGEVTLTVPRPDVERTVNEYVETPIRQANTTTSTCQIGNIAASNQKCLKNERGHHRHHHHHHHHQQHHHHHHHSHQLQQQQQTHSQQQTAESTAHAKISTATRGDDGGILVSAQARIQDNSTVGRRNQSHLLQSSLSSASQLVGTITKQPVSFTKEPANVLGGSGSITSNRLNDPSLSIMCDFCGRCRCESCREPPPLPSRWLCDNSCFCSAETVLDYASCLCCIKGCFYHCADSGSGTDSEAGGNCADEPCSCTGPRRTARWACLGALTFVLPCLLCYWPLKGCVTMCEACYAKHASQGCRCDPNAPGNRHHPAGGPTSVVSRDSRDPEKRLLDPVTPEL